MAFEFNWRNANQRQPLYTEQRVDYGAQPPYVQTAPTTVPVGYRPDLMAGYRPNDAMTAQRGLVSDSMLNKWNEPYKPSDAYSPDILDSYDANIRQTELAEIDQQIAANNAKIAQLEAQLLKAKGNSAYADDLDRRLAANRVKANDYANAQTHLGRIESRELARLQREQAEKLADKNKATASEKAKAELRGQIEDLDVAIPYYDNKASKDAAIAKRNRLVDQFNREYGASLPHYGESVENALTPDEWEQFKIANTDKNGNWTSDAARKLYSTRTTLSAAEAQKAKEGANTKTDAEIEQERKELRAKLQKAVDGITAPAQYVGEKVTVDIDGKPVEFEVSYDSYNKRYEFKAKGHTLYKAGK